MIDYSKRQFIQGLTLVLGSAAASQLMDGSGLSSALAYTPQNGSELKTGKLFDQHQMQALKTICDVVMPKTDTLAASELDVHGFIDHQLHHVFSQKEQTQVIAIINKIEQQSLAIDSQPFSHLSVADQTSLLEAVESQLEPFSETDRTSLKLVKSLVVFGYFTTEYGATKVLKYQAVPGGFKGSVPYASVGTSWGSLGFY